MSEVVIVDALRTPFGRFGGSMKDITAAELGGIVISEVLKRAQVKPEQVEEVTMGVNLPGSDRSIARQAALKAEIPDETPAYTVDRACCSSLTATAMQYRAIKLGERQVGIGGGTENMSQVPYFIHEARFGQRIGDVVLKDQLVISCPYTGAPRAVQAGKEALEFEIEREEQDKWALRSQQYYQNAYKENKFKDEIIPLTIEGKKETETIEDDESPRPNTTLEKLAKLPTVYGSPTVTPGNAPGLSTGASVLLVMSKEKADQMGLKPIATILGHGMAAGHPQRIASIPAYAAYNSLENAGLKLDDIDLIEINEAFAAMPLVTTKIWSNDTSIDLETIREKVNVNGGSIAIGHPTGATGGRLLATIIYELKRRGGGTGLVTICGGIGQGESFVLKV